MLVKSLYRIIRKWHLSWTTGLSSWFVEITGASYQVFLLHSFLTLTHFTNPPQKLPSSFKLPCPHPPPPPSMGREAAVFWARSQAERLGGKTACGHRDNNCGARASRRGIIVSRPLWILKQHRPSVVEYQWNSYLLEIRVLLEGLGFHPEPFISVKTFCDKKGWSYLESIVQWLFWGGGKL